MADTVRLWSSPTRPMQAMRLFVGEPVWTPYNRPQEDHPSRSNYLKAFGPGGTDVAPEVAPVGAAVLG